MNSAAQYETASPADRRLPDIKPWDPLGKRNGYKSPGLQPCFTFPPRSFSPFSSASDTFRYSHNALSTFSHDNFCTPGWSLCRSCCGSFGAMWVKLKFKHLVGTQVELFKVNFAIVGNPTPDTDQKDIHPRECLISWSALPTLTSTKGILQAAILEL